MIAQLLLAVIFVTVDVDGDITTCELEEFIYVPGQSIYLECTQDTGLIFADGFEH